MSTDQLNPDPAGAAGAPEAVAGDSEAEQFSEEDGVLYDHQVKPEYGILGFTLRELLIVAVWLIAFITSFFPFAGGGTDSVWTQGIHWILPVGVPTVAVFLLVLRRFSPDGIRRVGSLGIDQFASVAFSVAAVFWAQSVWSLVTVWVITGSLPEYWVNWVQLITMLGLVVLTVFAPLIPGLREDFHGRLVTLAHRNANPVRPVIPRPRPVAPTRVESIAPTDATAATDETAPGEAPAPDRSGTAVAEEHVNPADQTAVLDVEPSDQNATDEFARLGFAEQVPLTSHASGGYTGTDGDAGGDTYVPGYARRSRTQDGDAEAQQDAAAQVDLDATNPREDAPASQPFWALAPTERDVFDERGEPLFRIGPTAWALVIEDRGGAYVVRHDDGRIGYLHDIADMTRG